jgi:hypothetical protein
MLTFPSPGPNMENVPIGAARRIGFTRARRSRTSACEYGIASIFAPRTSHRARYRATSVEGHGCKGIAWTAYSWAVGSQDEVRTEYRRRGRQIAIDACEAILGGRIEAYEGARAIWWNAWTLLSDEPEGGELAPFIGEATEWEDHPEARAEIERSITEMARDLLDRWGRQANAIE